MVTLTANELKTKGAKILENILKDSEEAIISVRGKDCYVVMDMNRYNYLRECELESALVESLKDLKDKEYIEETVEEHIRRLKSDI